MRLVNIKIQKQSFVKMDCLLIIFSQKKYRHINHWVKNQLCMTDCGHIPIKIKSTLEEKDETIIKKRNLTTSR